jgi:uncharacterized protein
MMKNLALALALACAWAVPAAAQEHTAAHLAAAEEVLEAANVRGAMEASMDMMLRSQLEASPQLRELEHVMREFFARHLTWNHLKDDFARLYASHFSEAELREIAAFYATPVGRKLAAETPALSEDAGRLGQQRVEANLPELQRMLMEHFERQGQ